MSEWTFYENVYGVTTDLLKCSLVPRGMRKLILEMDEALRKWRADRKNNCVSDSGVKKHYRAIESRNLDEIYEIFRDSTVERDRYLEVFPEYKESTTKTIEELEKEAEDLSEDLGIIDSSNEVANCAGAVSGGLRLLSLATPLAPGLSFFMNAASVTNGAIRTVTTVSEQLIKECHLGKAVKSVETHKKQFKKMERWFTYDECLTKSISAAIGSETMKSLFGSFQKLCQNIDDFKRDHPKTTTALEMISALSKVLLQADFSVLVAYSLISALFQIFWIHYGSRWLKDWSVGALHSERLKTLCVGGMYCAHTFLAWERLQNPLTSFYSTNTFAAACGIAIDLIPPLLDAKKKKGKSAGRSQVINIKNVAEKLRQELRLFQTVYNTLLAARQLTADD